jgi:hypothetical protein
VRTNFVGPEHFGQGGGILVLGIAAPFSGGSVTELSAIDAWRRAAVDDGMTVRL